MIKGLTYTIVTSPDFARARAFFVDTLGLGVRPDGDAPGFAWFNTGDGSGLAVQQSDAPTIELYLEVDDVDAAYAAWKARGVAMVDQPHDEPFGRVFAFTDPDGRTLYAWKPA